MVYISTGLCLKRRDPLSLFVFYLAQAQFAIHVFTIFSLSQISGWEVNLKMIQCVLVRCRSQLLFLEINANIYTASYLDLCIYSTATYYIKTGIGTYRSRILKARRLEAFILFESLQNSQEWFARLSVFWGFWEFWTDDFTPQKFRYEFGKIRQVNSCLVLYARLSYIWEHKYHYN